MPYRIRFHETGGPQVLRREACEAGAPGPGEVLLRQCAVALNMEDSWRRAGLEAAELPSGLGEEGAGIIQATGPGVHQFAPGDRVTYTGSAPGAYCDMRVLPDSCLIRLPDAISFQTAAAITSRGLMAASLLRSLHHWQAGDTLLLQGAAGGMGLLLAQWAKLLGLNVIGGVQNKAQAALARAHGCDHVVNVRQEDVAARARQLTGGAGVDGVIDCLGRETFGASQAALRPRGLLVSVAVPSSAMPSAEAFAGALDGSHLLSRPRLSDFLADPLERAALAGELFVHVIAGRLRVPCLSYRLEDAVQAHHDLESGLMAGFPVFMV